MFGLLTRRRSRLADPSVASNPVPRRAPTLEPSVIASNMNVLGNIISDGILDIDGQVDGNVTAHTVTLRSNGRIRGDLHAEEVFVHGTVDGLIKSRVVSLFANAKVRGTVMHETLAVEDGAEVNGKLKRTEFPAVQSELGIVSSAPAFSSANSAPEVVPLSLAEQESWLEGDADHPVNEKEIKILENLRLIS